MKIQCWKRENASTRNAKSPHKGLVLRDILELICDEINNQGVLYSLCLVNKLFNSVFSRGLYERIYLEMAPGWRARHHKKGFHSVMRSQKAFERVCKTGNLQHTKTIVAFSTLWDTKPGRNLRNWDDDDYFNTTLLTLIQYTPNLVSYGSCGFDPCGALLTKLAELPELRNLSLSFTGRPAGIQQYSIDVIEPVTLTVSRNLFLLDKDAVIHPDAAWYLPKFRNLRKLSLLEVGRTKSLVPIWGACLLQVLLRNPDLRLVRLSTAISSRTLYDVGPRSPWALMFRSVCNAYETSTGHALELDEIFLDAVFHPLLSPFPKVTETAVRSSLMPADAAAQIVFPLDVPPASPGYDATLYPYKRLNILAERQYKRLDMALRALSAMDIDTERMPDFPHVTEAIIHFYGFPAWKNSASCLLGVFRRVLAKFINATALWYAPVELMYRTKQNKKQLRKTALRLFKKLKKLRYLRLTSMAWTCLRDGDKVKLVALEPLEDQLECPQFFLVPLVPRMFSGLYHHDL